MTTALNENNRPGLPEPHAYASHVSEVLARKQAKRAKRRRNVLYVVAVLVTMAASAVLPALYLAVICIGLPLLIVAGALGSTWREAREYNQDHDLP